MGHHGSACVWCVSRLLGTWHAGPCRAGAQAVGLMVSSMLGWQHSVLSSVVWV